MGRVVVVGSVNLDTVLHCDHLPGPGETVLAGAMSTGFGGKGANQAVAAARLGASVALVGAVGDDGGGVAALADLTAEGVDTAGVAVVAGQPTGHATVLVDPAGENAIVVAPGANAALTAATVTGRLRRVAVTADDVLLVSGEVPVECAEAAVRAGAAAGARAVYNLAPFRGLHDWLADLRPIVVLNETEAAQASGPRTALGSGSIGTGVGGWHAAAALTAWAGAVVVTLGADGALVLTGGRVHTVDADRVEAVDTTGAGDAFCGALATRLAAGRPLPEAVAAAVRAGTIAVTGAGARGRLATAADL
jgi:ribokinase